MSTLIERQPGGDLCGECTYKVFLLEGSENTQTKTQVAEFTFNRPSDLPKLLIKAAEEVSKARGKHGMDVYKHKCCCKKLNSACG